MTANNYCVIMAGGVGSRFWPFSRNDKPKQFLDFFGTGRSLLQMTIDRFRPIVPIENILIVTNVMYRNLVLEQIPDLQSSQVLCEPARRNTAPCIAYAVARIKAMAKGEHANIVVAASDHLILQEEKFRETITRCFDFIKENDALITLGMKPTRPETGYGYIQMGDEAMSDKTIYKVKAFTEKPNLEVAKKFVESGDFLWNSGIFLWSLESIRTAFNEFLPEVASKFKEGADMMGTSQEDEFIQAMFPTCPSISIDYGVMEKANNVYVHSGDIGWSDVGTWGSAHQHSRKDRYANALNSKLIQTYNTRNSLIFVPDDKAAIVSGLKDYIVVDTGDVLMICPRSEEQNIKSFVEDIKYTTGDKHI